MASRESSVSEATTHFPSLDSVVAIVTLHGITESGGGKDLSRLLPPPSIDALFPPETVTGKWLSGLCLYPSSERITATLYSNFSFYFT